MRLTSLSQPKIEPVDLEESSVRALFEEEQNKIDARVYWLTKWFMPNSRNRIFWESFIFIAIWYNSLVTPIRIFIMSGYDTPQSLIYIDVVFDFIFVIDTLLHFFLPFMDEESGEVITDIKAIRRGYLGSWSFYINAIACIPILKTPLSLFLNNNLQQILNKNFNVLRMIRIINFTSQFAELKKFLSRKDPVNESVFRMGVILFFALLLMCIFGCVYFGLSTAGVDDICPAAEDFQEEILSAEMWVAGDSVITDVMDPSVCNDKCNQCPQMLFFTRSVYFLMQTLFTIGYGDSVVPSTALVEMGMACIFMLFGVFGYGLIIANMTSVLSNLDVVSMRYRHEIDTISRWLSFRSVPETLRERVNMLFTYLSRRQCGMLNDALFADLPPKLSQDFAVLDLSLLTKVPFFNPNLRSETFLYQVASALVQRVYTPGSIIMYHHEMQRELVIVKSGRADVYVRGSNAAVGCLAPGDFMGDYQLLFGTVNQVGVKTHEFTEVLVLSYPSFKAIMNHPHHWGFEFQSMDENFRQSSDQGALDTIRNSTVFLKKISLTVSNINNKSKNKKLENMMNETAKVVKGFRIHPNSKVHVCRAVLSLGAIMYYSISCLVRIAQLYRANELNAPFDTSYILDLIFDVLFIVDMVFQARVYAYVSYENGRNVIVDRELMTKNYIQSGRFKLDLFSVIPFDIISIFVGFEAVARIPKIARVLQIPRVISALRSSLDESMQMTMTETHVSVLLMFLASVLIIVWSSAGWNAIRDNENGYESVYWSLTTLTTVGYGDLTPVNFRQTCYALFVGAFGATFSAAIIANVTSFFHDVEISEDNIEHKVTCIKCFMERHNSSFENIKQIQDYFHYIEREQDGLNEELLLSKSVPDHIKKHFLVHITQPMVLNCVFFAGCDAGFLRRIMSDMEQRFYGTQFTIVNSSKPADGMYFVKKGVVHIMRTTENGTLKANKKVEADESFAEECLLGHYDRNPFLAMAATDCELWFLSKSVFNNIVNDFPHLLPLFQNITKTPLALRRASIHAINKAAELANRRKDWFIHPDHYFIQIWFVLVLLFTLYNLIAIPYRAAFMENQDIVFKWVAFDYVGDILYIFDIIIRSSFLAYYDDNRLVTSRKQIRSNYNTSGTLKRHVLAMLPIEFLVIFIPTLCPLWSLQLWSLLRLNKITRSLEIVYLFNRVESTLASAGVKVPKNFLRVNKLVMLILLIAHWAGCIFFVIANLDQHAKSGSSEDPNNWANAEGLLKSDPTCPGTSYDHDQIMQQYIASLYWAMATLTTVGYGDITANEGSTPEILFATGILIIGTAAYTLVIALLEDIVSQLDVTSSLYQRKIHNLDIYMLTQGLPESLKVKLTAYYEALWPATKGVKGKKLFEFVPRSLRSELKFDMLSPLLKKSFFIKDCKTDFVVAVVNSLSLEMFLPDDVLFYEGERCDSLWYLSSGEVDYLTSKVKFQTVTNTLLGEWSFFGFEPYICTAKAVDKCEAFRLSMNDFLEHLANYQLVEKYAAYLELKQDILSKSKASIVKMTQNLNSSKMAKMMATEVEKEPIPKGVILPDTNFRRAWDMLALAFVMVLVIIIPQQISFANDGISFIEFIGDVVIDTFFICDVYARASHFAVMKDGFLISSPRDFRKLYFKDGFHADLLSVLPVSFIGYLCGVRGDTYGFLRFFQLTRFRRFGKYLDSSLETIHTWTNVIISTGLVRIVQIFLLVIFLCHWIACVYHFIGQQNATSDDNWLATDQIINEHIGKRYLRAFYWALYTVSTVGYGSVPVISIPERVFAMFVMLVGAVICDAGITAVLTSIISTKDQQAGTNNRRIQCAKEFMKNTCVSKELQDRVLDFYNYTDTELQNIEENDVLEDLSPSLKCEIISFYCYDSLRNCAAFQDFSHGAIMSLLNDMLPYLAIPGEKVSEIGKECHSVYVLQRGRMSRSDAKGAEEIIPEGGVIGHLITEATEKNEGLPVKWLMIEISADQGLKAKSGDPYVLIDCGSKSCRSNVNKGKTWLTRIRMKVHRDCKVARIRVIGSRKNQPDMEWGVAEVNLSEKIDAVPLELSETNGKRAGNVTIRLTCFDLQKHEIVSTHELTATAQTYCHLYRLETHILLYMRHYLTRSKLPHIKDRIPICKKGKPIQFITEENAMPIKRHSTSDIPSTVQEKENNDASISDTDTKSANHASKQESSSQQTMTQINERRSLLVTSKEQKCLPRININRDWDNLVDFVDNNRVTNESLIERATFFHEWASES